MIIFIFLEILENNHDNLIIKPLTEVSSKPILFHLIDNLKLTSSDYIHPFNFHFGHFKKIPQ